MAEKRDDAVMRAREDLEAAERDLGPEHLEVAAKLDAVAALCLERGGRDEAVVLGTRALEIRERLLGPDHLDVAGSLDNLVSIDFDDFDWAEPRLRRALAIQVKSLGPDNPDLLTGLYMLSTIYKDTGRHAEAKELELRMKQIGKANRVRWR